MAALSLANGLLCFTMKTIALHSRPPSNQSVLADVMANPSVVRVLEASALTYALLLLFAVSAAGRRKVPRTAVVALVLATPVLGPTSALCLFFAASQWREPKQEEDFRLTMYALAQAMAILAIFFIVIPQVCQLQVPCANVDAQRLGLEIVVALLAPMSLLLLTIPASPTLSNIFKAIYLVAYLLIGSLGFASHTQETGLSAPPAADVVEKVGTDAFGNEFFARIVQDSLATGASRALLVNFIHLNLACALFISECDTMRGAAGITAMAIPFAGPAGSFGFFAGFEKYLQLRKIWQGESVLAMQAARERERNRDEE